MGARILSCNAIRSYLKQSVLQSSFTHWHVFLLPVTPQKRSQQLVVSHRKSIRNQPSCQRWHCCYTTGSALIFPWTCNSDWLQGEWEYLCLKMQAINAFASECKLHSPIPNLLIQENVCSFSFWEVRKRTSAQTTWADTGLGAPSSRVLHAQNIYDMVTERCEISSQPLPLLISQSRTFHSETTGWEWFSS